MKLKGIHIFKSIKLLVTTMIIKSFKKTILGHLLPLFYPLSFTHSQGWFSIMFQFIQPLLLPCPSHKTMMSWYSRDKQCQLQLADLSFSLTLPASVSGSLRIDNNALIRQPTIHSKASCTYQGVCKSYNNSHKKLGQNVEFSTRPNYANRHAQINKAYLQAWRRSFNC